MTAALELVRLNEGVASTTTLIISAGTEVQHESVLRILRDNEDDFDEFGRVRFEIGTLDTAGGAQRTTWAVLNEEHATLLLTYMRNNAVVKDFKKRLVHEFYAMRGALVRPQGPELLALAVIEAQQMLAEKDDRIAELEPKAEFYDALMESDGTYSMLAASKILGWGRNVMMRELRRSGVLQGNNLPYQRWEHHFKVVPGTYTHPSGGTVPYAVTFVRPSGLEFLRKKLDRALVVVT